MKQLLLVAALALACYTNAIDGSFHFDDAHAVQENPSIRSLRNFSRFFTDAGAFSILPQNQGYRPLLLVTYAATASLTGAVDARAFIAVNLFIHVLCAWLVLATLRETLVWIGRPRHAESIALLAALLFAAHPLFSECVDYVSARSESLSSLLMLMSLYAYLRARAQPRWIVASTAAIAGALLTKPTVTIFPLILIAFEAAAAERQSLRKIAPRFLAVCITVVGLGLLSARMTPLFAIQSASNYTRAEYFRSELPAYWHYLRLFVWPAGQSGDPNYPLAASFVEPRVLAAGLGLLGALGLSVTALIRRRYTGAGLATVWFVLCLFPASSLFPLAEVVNEHRPYLAAAALCALVAAAVVDGVPAWLRLDGNAAREATITVALALLIPCAVATVLRNGKWRTEETLWADVVEKAPESARAQMNYGLALMSNGHMSEAEPHLREAVRLAPYYPYAHINLGNLLTYQNRIPEGLGHLDAAIQYGANLFWSHFYRGLAAERINEPPAARAGWFAASTQLSPNFADGWYHLSLARDALGDVKGALEAAERAVELRGNYEDRFMLAYLLLKVGDVKRAQPILRALHKEHPDDGKVNFNLDYAARLSK